MRNLSFYEHTALIIWREAWVIIAILDLPCLPFCYSVNLSFCHNLSFFFNILRMDGPNLTKFCIHINIDKIYVGIVNRHF